MMDVEGKRVQVFYSKFKRFKQSFNKQYIIIFTSTQMDEEANQTSNNEIVIELWSKEDNQNSVEDIAINKLSDNNSCYEFLKFLLLVCRPVSTFGYIFIWAI